MGFIIGGGLVIGGLLGLLGSGGSIATVPILVYLVGQPEKVAIAGSLGIVGAIALLGGLRYARRGLVDWRSVLWFGVPGMAGSYGGAWLSRWVPAGVQLALFAVVMLVAAVFMLRRRKLPEQAERRSATKIVVDGFLVGLLTGLVGVGGGFLIVPALVLLGGLPAHLAIGSSLMIIALKSGAGFAKYVDVLADLGLSLDWMVIGVFVAAGAVGSIYGGKLAARLHQDQLRRAFGWFVIVMGVVMLAKTVPTL
ncbi:MAG: sulfite exporter TauE/SafE family protein [Planctomycetota bacterium]